ncbi:hypothetical protein [Halosolutus gelatinilyticus]|uniref:hypothetical protein n=1 Tax=Halosolutus gelatinilyticus TaxID=2931975 RepID=UPI001FF288C9|nr:hypothetical protein [Halosolutus gelatinilyticus]
MKPTFRPANGTSGIVVHDPIQGRQFPLRTRSAVDPKPADDDRFLFPVDGATTIETDRITLPFVVAVYVRDVADGELVAEAEHFAYEELPPGEYVLELMAPIKIYVRVGGPVTIASSTDHMRIEFDERRRLEIGARSNHRRPETTVTTTADPADLMAAVSTFGSALKTLSPERSLPSLRGHPPRLELGGELRIPDELSAPETGIRIELPPERSTVYAASTLAYYLGATLEPGPEPQIVTRTDRTYPLSGEGRDFEDEVERVLGRCFLLDCVARTEGLYRIALHERDVLDDRLDVDWRAAYDASPADRLETYLSVPYADLADLVPSWRLVTYATPAPHNATSLPFVVNELSLIRSAVGRSSTPEPAAAAPGIDEFFRSSRAPADTAVGTTRRSSEGPEPADASYVSLPDTDSLEIAWLGDERPVGANHLLDCGFEHRIERGRPSDEVEITVVCNDPAMSAEYDDANRSLYGNRHELPFDVTVHYDLATAELEDVLATDTDFLHYIGHSESDAFICHDGRVNAADVDRIGPHAFLLNGCTSYEQGIRLVEGGSVGGIVTHSDVGNEDATAIGRSIARLLNAGFSLRSALVIARDHRIVGTQYLVVGDGSAQVAQSEGGTPVRFRVDSRDDGRYDLVAETYPTVEAGMGAMYIPYLDDVDSHFLTGGALPTFAVEADELTQYLRLEDLPLVFDGSAGWTDAVDVFDR